MSKDPRVKRAAKAYRTLLGHDWRPTDCDGGWMGHLFGHRFKARITTTYDMAPTLRAAIMRGGKVSIGGFSLVPIETYHGDICTRCGERRTTPTEEGS